MTRHIVPEPVGHYGKRNTASHRRTKTVKKKKKKTKKQQQQKKHLASEEGENREMSIEFQSCTMTSSGHLPYT